MTNQDIDNIIHTICPSDEDFDKPCISPAYLKKELEALALEQEPCEDAISREDAEQMFRNIRCHLKPQDYKSAEEFNTRDLMLLNAEQMIHALPSVTQKSGRWIMSDDGLYRPICDKCGAHPWKGYIPTVEEATEVFKYCPNCGAKMVDPQESEDKE